jgi:hypothetical protein
MRNRKEKKGELKNIEEKATDELLMPLSCKHFLEVSTFEPRSFSLPPQT